MNNPVKAKLKSGKKTVGAFLQTVSPVSAEILSASDFDWLIVDLEHSPCSFETLQLHLQIVCQSSHSSGVLCRNQIRFSQSRHQPSTGI